MDPTLPDGLEVGDHAFLDIRGVVRIEAIQEHRGRLFVMTTSAARSGQRVYVPLPEQRHRLRAICSRSEAEERLALLLAPASEPRDGRSFSERAVWIAKACAEGDMPTRIAALRWLYHSPFALSWHQLRDLEVLVLGELAHWHGVEREGARYSEIWPELQRLPVFAPDARPDPRDTPPVPSSPVALPDHEPLGVFEVRGGAMAIGECPWRDRDEEDALAIVPAANGEWLAFHREGRDEQRVIVVHRDHATSARRLAADAREVAKLWVEGGCLRWIDAAVRTDPGFRDEIVYGEGPILAGRGVIAGVGGDGGFEVLGVEAGGVFVYFECPWG